MGKKLLMVICAVNVMSGMIAFNNVEAADIHMDVVQTVSSEDTSGTDNTTYTKQFIFHIAVHRLKCL